MKSFHKVFEADVAEVLDGELQPRSGAGDHDKLDVKCELLLVSCKATENEKSFTLTEKDWSEAVHFAKLEGLTPALAFKYAQRKLIALDVADLGGYLQELNELNTLGRKRKRQFKKLYKAHKELRKELESAERKIDELIARTAGKDNESGSQKAKG